MIAQIPNFEPHREQDQSSNQSANSPWQLVNLATGIWTHSELPLKEPASSNSFSAGEEISASSVCSLEWSPPGIAKHRRSALAVLTSNLVLSIWASDGNPKVSRSWGRRLLVNDCIESYLGVLERNETYDNTNHLLEKRRLRKRFRSFSWCSPNPDQGLPCNIGSKLRWGPYVLAVSNDDNQILFIVIDSPYTSISSKQTWTATVVAYFSLNISNSTPSTTTFEDSLQQQRHISHIAWSPWFNKGEDRLESVISYASNDKLYARNIAMLSNYEDQSSPEILVLDNETLYHDIALRYGGPLRWCPKACNNRMFLVAFTRLRVFCFAVSNSQASDFTTTSADIDQNWDPISGR